MAIPSSGYSTADFTNPNSDLTDYVAVVPLADMPADFWTAVSSSDGARGRVAKDDGTTELASEWVEFDDVAETGYVFFKWSGTLSSTGTSTVRIYPPQSGNSSYAVTNTFGRNNVWTGYEAVYHLHEDPTGASPQFTDSTGNGNDGIANNMEAGDSIASILGDGVALDGADEDIETGNAYDATTNLSVQAWVLQDQTAQTAPDVGVVSKYDTTNGRSWLLWISGSDEIQFILYDGGNQISPTQAMPDLTYVHAVGTYDGSTVRLYTDGSEVGTGTSHSGSADNSTADVVLGSYEDTAEADGRNLAGELDEVRISLTTLSADYISQDYSNQNDPTTFWGTWTWNSAGVTLTAEQGSYTLTGQTANLLRSLILGADQGSYTLSGQAVTFLQDYVIVAEQGTYTTSGSSTTFLENEVLEAAQGSYTFTGQDAELAKLYILSADQGTYTLTGQDATLLFNRVLAAQQGTYTLTGQDTDLLRNLVLQAGAGNYVLSGQNVTLTVVSSTSTEKLRLDSIISDTLSKDSTITQTLSLKSIIDD